MVFSTLFCARREHHASGRLRRALVAAWLALALGFAVSARAEGILARSAELEAGEEGYSLNAGFSVQLTPTLEDALGKGISLYFVAEFELVRPRWYWLDERIAEFQRYTKLNYNALTRQYRLSSGSLYQNFDSLQDALKVMGRVRSHPLLNQDALRKGAQYHAAVRMRLDVSQLPKPLQMSALTSSDWSLESEWLRWRVSP